MCITDWRKWWWHRQSLPPIYCCRDIIIEVKKTLFFFKAILGNGYRPPGQSMRIDQEIFMQRRDAYKNCRTLITGDCRITLTPIQIGAGQWLPKVCISRQNRSAADKATAETENSLCHKNLIITMKTSLFNSNGSFQDSWVIS